MKLWQIVAPLFCRLQRKQEKAEARRKAEQEDRERIQKREAEKLAKEQAEKDAAREARRLKEEEEKALNAAKDALEVACGTGIPSPSTLPSVLLAPVSGK